MSDKHDDTVWAFPRQPHYYVKDQTQHFYEGAYGMELRDYFAAKALPEAIASERELRASMIKPDDFHFEAVAQTAYRMADAMLAERAR